ncbi:MAG: NIPSNAP family protein [Burkholderiales bacterium]|nr:NIPSNAP family protein [Burkholderiales bacterium]
MIYELRVYHAAPGKLPALIDRFRKHTVAIWKKHDIRPLGFWTVDIGENTNDLFYLLQWDDVMHRERAGAAFQADKDWIAARDKSEEAGPLVSAITRTLLRPTDFSQLK